MKCYLCGQECNNRAYDWEEYLGINSHPLKKEFNNEECSSEVQEAWKKCNFVIGAFLARYLTEEQLFKLLFHKEMKYWVKQELERRK